MIAALYPFKKNLKACIGEQLSYVETSIFGEEYKANGSFCVVGPSPLNRKWYAKITMKNDLIEKVE